MRNLAGNPDVEAIRLELETKVDTWWQQTNGKDFAYYESPEFKASGLPSTMLLRKWEIIAVVQWS
ncbi:MAG TPA: hypothetical protein VGN34_03770 [Ktedonobacteraceae bacterium]